MTTVPAQPVGVLLREWRERRRMTQLDLSIQADISTRHLSFVETGRSRPTPEMILRLTEHLGVPLRERNQLLLAGGYAPAYRQRPFDAPELAGVRRAMRLILDAHAPYPALVLDRLWTMVDANDAVPALVRGCAGHLLEPPVNVLRLTLHPEGLAPRIANLAQWRGHLLHRVAQRREATADPRLAELLDELHGYPGGTEPPPRGEVVLPMRLRTDDGDLALFSISAAVETAGDVTVQELIVESFYPADDATAALLRRGRDGMQADGELLDGDG